MSDILKKTFTASIWSSLAEIAAKVISPAIFLILTKILSPTDFGIVAIATTVLGFASIVTDMGTAKVLIQSQLNGEKFKLLCNCAFWINLTIGLTLFLACFLSANFLARLNDYPTAAPVIRVMAFQILFNSLCIVQTAYMRKELKFKYLFYIRLITVVTPALISVPIAFLGYGYWSIVAGSITGSILSCIVLWYMSNWKPKFHMDKSSTIFLFSKSIWTTIEQIFSYLPLAFDTYLIANYLSTRDLGLYTSSRTLFSAAISLCLAPVMPVLFSSFSKLIDDNQRFKRAVLIAQKLVFILAATMGLTVYGFRTYIEDIIFDNEWTGINQCFGIIFLIFGIEYFYSAIIESIRAKGDFKGLSINTMISNTITLVVLFIAVRYGLTIYVLARSLSLFLFYPGIFYLSRKDCNITIINCLKNVNHEIMLFSGFFIAIIFANHLSTGYYTTFTLLIIITLTIMALLLNINKSFFLNLFKQIRK